MIVVDQNEDERVRAIARGRGLELVHAALRARSVACAQRGPRARRRRSGRVPRRRLRLPVGAPRARRERASRRRELDGLTGRAVDAEGRSSPSWKRRRCAADGRQPLEPRDLVHDLPPRARSSQRVGAFDERLGLGSAEPWSSGEEIDYLIRAVRCGARDRVRPVTGRVQTCRAPGRPAHRRPRRCEHRLPAAQAPLSRRVVARMLVRPLGGMLASLVRVRSLHGPRTSSRRLRGRVRGYRGREAREQLGVTVEPGLEREPLDGTRASGCRVARHGRRARASRASASSSALRRLVPLEAVRMGHADAGVVADELRRRRRSRG